jgi:hypothetical protein
MGLGLTFFGDHEIVPGTFIQLDLSKIVSPLRKFDLSFSANSVTGGDEWGLFLTNTAGSISGTPNLTGKDEGVHFINATGFTFLDVTAVSGTVLVHTLDSTILCWAWVPRLSPLQSWATRTSLLAEPQAT